MLDVFMTKEYLTILCLIVITCILLYINPSYFQNKRYKKGGDACPNALWYALILFLIGTGLYYGINQYSYLIL